MGPPFDVLFVDNEPGLADLAATFVEREDERVRATTAVTVAEALEILADRDIDCIVSDYDMPGRNGLEFLEVVRERFDSIPFVLFTGKGSEEIASDAIGAGANDYLQKKAGTDQYTILANIVANLVEKYRAEKEKERNLQVMETAQEGLSIVGEDGVFEYVNRAYAETFGYDQSELVGKEWSFIYPEADLEHIKSEVIPSIPEEGVWSGETTFVRSDGTRIVADHTLAHAQGGLICTVRDITEKLEREEELEERRTLLDLFIGEVEQYAIFTLDPAGYVTTWNSGAKRITGYDTDEILGKHISVFYPDEDVESGLPDRLLARAKAEGVATHEGWRVRKDGSRFWEDVTISAIRGDGGELVGFGNVVYDATREQTEQQRQQATEAKIRRLHDTTRKLVDAETKADVATTAVDALQTTLELPVGGCWLYDETDGMLRPVASTDGSEELIGPLPTFERGQGLVWKAFDSGEPMVFDDVSVHPERYNEETPIRSELILPLGRHGVLVVGSTVVADFDESDTVVAKILAENTGMALERVEQTTRLKEERAFIESALDHLSDTFYVFSADGSPVRWNSQVNRVTGYTDEEIAEMHVLDFFEGEGKACVADAIQEVVETGDVEVEANLVTKDGTEIPYKFTGSLLTDADGNTTGLVGVGRDITEQQAHEAELERRNERLEELASVLSHDLRNPLNVAQGYLEMVQEEHDIDQLQQVERALQRMDTLIEDLLVLARRGRVISETDTLSLRDAAEQAWEHIEHRDAELTVTTDRTIEADETRFLQLLENLMRNSVEHSSTGREERSSAGNRKPEASGDSRASPDDSVEHGGSGVTVRVGDLENGFYVEDTGPGFPDAVRERVKNDESIEGHLGLRIVRAISDAHGWEMTVGESAEGGARVEFRVAGQ